MGAVNLHPEPALILASSAVTTSVAVLERSRIDGAFALEGEGRDRWGQPNGSVKGLP
jgi:hypothetical protein